MVDEPFDKVSLWFRFRLAERDMNNRLADILGKQCQEALGPVNKWYCSQFHGYEVTDPEVLLAYYIKHGGASHFRSQHEKGSGTPDAVSAHG